MSSNLDQLWYEVGAAWKECPLVGTNPAGSCTTCGDKGIIYAFPRLMEECPVYHSNNIVPACQHTSLHCPTCICDGFGISIRQDLEILLECARSLRLKDWTPAPILWPSSFGWVFLWQGKDLWGYGDTPQEAILQACKKVLVAQGWRLGI